MTRADLAQPDQPRVEVCLVAPALDGPVSGGTLYNRELRAALVERGCRVVPCTLDDARLASLLATAQHVFVDTLYLDAVPALTRLASGKLFLLTHYLPALVAAGRMVTRAELSVPEARALRAAPGFLVTSGFMREALGPLLAPKRALLVVQPGSRARLAPRIQRVDGAPLRALLIANLVPGKGIAALLEALSGTLREDDRFALSIIGRLDADPEYAAECARLVAASPALARRVAWRGEQTHERVLSALAEADVLLSASTMESYGMALGDARVSGVPIIARAGGHSAAHVTSIAGGQLVTSAAELGRSCLALARSPALLAERWERARRHALPARPWSLAAGELLAQLENLAECAK